MGIFLAPNSFCIDLPINPPEPVTAIFKLTSNEESLRSENFCFFHDIEIHYKNFMNYTISFHADD